MLDYVNATVNPICCVCQEKIGEMPLDIYQRAVELRGEFLFCPDCRTHKCDSCGWFIPSQLMVPFVDGKGKFIGNCCETCVTFLFMDDPEKEDFPHFRTMLQPNLTYVKFHSPSQEQETRWDER